jgi:hypothetical protein
MQATFGIEVLVRAAQVERELAECRSVCRAGMQEVGDVGLPDDATGFVGQGERGVAMVRVDGEQATLLEQRDWRVVEPDILFRNRATRFGGDAGLGITLEYQVAAVIKVVGGPGALAIGENDGLRDALAEQVVAIGSNLARYAIDEMVDAYQAAQAVVAITRGAVAGLARRASCSAASSRCHCMAASTQRPSTQRWSPTARPPAFRWPRTTPSTASIAKSAGRMTDG